MFKQIDSVAQMSQSPLPRVPYADVINSKRGASTWLNQLGEFGISLITGAPTSEGIVNRLGGVVCKAQV